MNKVAVVVTTYNREAWLKRNTESLLSQSYPVYKIVVVDNNSNDGTQELLNRLKSSGHPIVNIKLNENTGAAGGVHYGVKYILEHDEGYDYIWIMDDDCVPYVNCLEVLLNSANSKDVMFPLVVDIDNNESHIWHKKLKKDSGIHEIEYFPFTGPLIPYNMAQKVGLPNKDLFIYGEDLDYSMRLKLAGAKILVASSAVLTHPHKYQKKLNFVLFTLMPYDFTEFRLYYNTRNAIYLDKLYNRDCYRKRLKNNIKQIFQFLFILKFKEAFLKLNGVYDGLNKRIYVKRFK